MGVFSEQLVRACELLRRPSRYSDEAMHDGSNYPRRGLGGAQLQVRTGANLMPCYGVARGLSGGQVGGLPPPISPFCSCIEPRLRKLRFSSQTTVEIGLEMDDERNPIAFKNSGPR
jgi:hypothetical protein